MNRQLSFEADVLRPAQGMLRKFSIGSGLQCFQGLPPPLGRSMLFAKGIMPYSREFGRRRGFPSYSWTGWKSNPRYHGAVVYRETWDPKGPNSGLHSWVIWHCVCQDGQIYRLNDIGRLDTVPEPNGEDARKNVIQVLREIPLSSNNINLKTIQPTAYPLLFFWTVVIRLDLGYQTKDPTYPKVGIEYDGMSGDYGDGVAIMDMTEATGEMRFGKFAILASSARGYRALLLEWKKGVAKRRSIILLKKDVLEKCLEPGPRWEAIVLG
jgi:hypothetical protein